MSYSYEKQKPRLFTDDGQRFFLRVRDCVDDLLRTAGSVRFSEAMKVAQISANGAFAAFDVWDAVAAFDRMVELRELQEVTNPDTIAQHRVFVRHPSRAR